MKTYKKAYQTWGLVRVVAGSKPGLHGSTLPGRGHVLFPVLFGSREDARRYRHGMPAHRCYRVVRVVSVFTWTV